MFYRSLNRWIKYPVVLPGSGPVWCDWAALPHSKLWYLQTFAQNRSKDSGFLRPYIRQKGLSEPPFFLKDNGTPALGFGIRYSRSDLAKVTLWGTSWGLSWPSEAGSGPAVSGLASARSLCGQRSGRRRTRWWRSFLSVWMRWFAGWGSRIPTYLKLLPQPGIGSLGAVHRRTRIQINPPGAPLSPECNFLHSSNCSVFS